LAVLGDSLDLIHVTDGAPHDVADARAAGCATREQYARARRAELLRAMDVIGIPAVRCHQLGLVEQEASEDLEGLAWRLTCLLAALSPQLVLTHAYEGGHRDHDATAFATRMALTVLGRLGHMVPPLAEFTSCYATEGGVRAGAFLSGGPGPLFEVELEGTARVLKSGIQRRFATQAGMLSALGVLPERYRPAPEYDFEHAPHAGTLYYETLDAGITSEEWRRRAAAAKEGLERSLRALGAAVHPGTGA
jgi:LmbE family N-acetylglucosaminyl deacetylase